MEEQRPWHRLFGLSWRDFFRGLPVVVDREKDLSLKQQRLDLVILRKGTEALPCRLPDGFEDLAPHNLISFKSYQEALDGRALNELVGHSVNYRKEVSPSMDELPEEDFRLFKEAPLVPDPLEEMARETIKEILEKLPVEERLKGLSADELLAALSPEMREALARRLKDNGSALNPG